MFFCIVLVIHHSEGVDSGFSGLNIFGCTGFSISFRFLHSSNNVIVVHFLRFSEFVLFDREAEVKYTV